MDKTDIQVEKVSESYVRVHCEDHITQELWLYFTFNSPGYQFHPLYKARKWDGKIRLFNKKTRQIPTGLLRYLAEFAKERQYTISADRDLTILNMMSLVEAEEFISSLKICDKGQPLPPRDYQITAFAKAIRYKRMLMVSPTASGKSFIIYTIMRYLLQNKCARGLIIVPTVALVEQMFSDFVNYATPNGGISIKDTCHRIYEGQDRTIDLPVIISTWQSIHEMDSPEFLRKFDFVIGDEAHTFQAKSLSDIMLNMSHARYRIGTTGTLNDMKVHRLVIEGHFGPFSKITTTKKLMDDGHVSQLNIKCIVLKHPEHACVKRDYAQEMEFLCTNEARNRFIRNLAVSIKGNTLILFQYIEKHGEILYRMVSEKVGNSRKVFFVHGGTEVEQREEVRRITEQETDAIICASYGVFSTGTNIKNLHNCIFASPSKSRIRVLQSIGRVLRLHENKTHATLYDISDDLRSEKFTNFTLKHYAERIKIYRSEKFNVSTYNVEVNYAA